MPEIREKKFGKLSMEDIIDECWLSGCSFCRQMEEERQTFMRLGIKPRTPRERADMKKRRFDSFKNKLFELIG